MAYFKSLSILAFTSLLAIAAHAEPIFFDSFESGDTSATNNNGFTWDKNNRTSVVKTKVVEYNDTAQDTVFTSNRNWKSNNAEHSLSFLYESNESWTEQRFKIGKPYSEIWMGFWLRVPTNFTHPKTPNAGDNQKLFFLWMDGYSTKGEGSSVGMEFRGNGRGGSYFYGKISPGGNRGAGIDKGIASFIEVPKHRGKWMHLVVHVTSESFVGAKDGLMEVWRKWEGTSEYVKTQDLKNQPIRLSSRVNGFANGYLMGWANAVYPVDTEFLIDDFELSTTPLFLHSNAPNSPSGIAIK
ncbi:MAG: hypothetical protein WD623_11305 [Marinobacter sp.]|uniref:hypothetical protein n=1 Tax=Marinobacter sp. TaxID=50741 RepID=UPI0034A0108E